MSRWAFWRTDKGPPERITVQITAGHLRRSCRWSRVQGPVSVAAEEHLRRGGLQFNAVVEAHMKHPIVLICLPYMRLRGWAVLPPAAADLQRRFDLSGFEMFDGTGVKADAGPFTLEIKR